jgi:hypothetical protein
MSVSVRSFGSGVGPQHVLHLPGPATRRPATRRPTTRRPATRQPVVLALALAFAVALAALLALGTLSWPVNGSGHPIPSPRPLSSVG